MSEPLKCSVIIPTYNREELLRHTLDSITKQTLPADQFEVLVIDDGSSDGTAAMVETFKDRLDLRYFFQEDEGFRVAKARNLGILNATAPLCVFIDTGNLLHSDCVRQHVATHEGNDGPVGLVGYAYGMQPTLKDPSPIQRLVDFADPDGSIERLQEAGWGDIRDEWYSRYTDEFSDEPAPWIIFWTGNASARTDLLREVGMFDENFHTWGVEDVDLGYRLHRAGAKMMVNRLASSTHYPHETNFDANMESAGGNLAYMVEKYPTPIVRLLVETPPELHFDLNRIIRDKGIPLCADFVAAEAEAAEAAAGA